MLLTNAENAASISCNNISTGLVYVSGNSSSTVTMTNNVWGSINPTFIANQIIDYYDDSNRPKADFIPFLTKVCEYVPNVCQDKLSGTVIDLVTGHPISNAEVQIPNQSTAFTDDKGYFRFDNLANGSAELFIEKTGYYPKS